MRINFVVRRLRCRATLILYSFLPWKYEKRPTEVVYLHTTKLKKFSVLTWQWQKYKIQLIILVLGIDNFVHNIETASKYSEFFGSFFEACCCLWILSRIGILFRKLFWPTVKKHCSIHGEKIFVNSWLNATNFLNFELIRIILKLNFFDTFGWSFSDLLNLVHWNNRNDNWNKKLGCRNLQKQLQATSTKS